MADIINVPTYEQIATILSKLATNYSNLASVFYDVFYNSTPADVTFKMYDESGVLQEYTIPNRAKDMASMLNGEGNPENNIAASMGVTYQDLRNGKLYVKETPTGNEGWSEVTTNNYLSSFIMKGVGSPEGNIPARIGVLYIDEELGILYIKTTNGGNTGWQMTLISTDSFANKDLSNLSEYGEAKVTDLADGAVDERVTQELNQYSSDNKVPSAECVYNALITKITNNQSSVIAALGYTPENRANLVQSVNSESTEDQYPSAKCMYRILGDLEYRINNL